MSQVTPGLATLVQQQTETVVSNDIQQAALTAFFTVLTGVLVYLIKTVIDEYWLSHLREYKKLKAEVAYTLVKYANAYSNAETLDKETTEKVAETIRDLAAKVSAYVETRPAVCWGVPRNQELMKASTSLIGLSNGTYAKNKQMYDSEEYIDRMVMEIKHNLKLKSVQE